MWRCIDRGLRSRSGYVALVDDELGLTAPPSFVCNAFHELLSFMNGIYAHCRGAGNWERPLEKRI